MAVKVNDLRKGLQFVLKAEDDTGFYTPDISDDKTTHNQGDRGGGTKWGVTQRSYDWYREGKHLPRRDVSEMSPEEALENYDVQYWQASGCDSIDYPLNVVVFDTAVNCGPGRAKNWLKNATNPEDYLETRKNYYIDIVKRDPSQMKWFRGWINRINNLKKFLQIENEKEGAD